MKRKKTIQVPTTGVFDFETLILDEEAKYVDKTALLYELARHKADAQLFLSRPRRFGKSLMLSTLQAMFEGRRDLFRGLAIDKLPWEGWKKKYPVYSFTMASAVGETYDDFSERLGALVEGLCREAGVPYRARGPVSGRFEDFLSAAAAKSPTKKIVVLIDEYDEPIAKFLDDIKTLKRVHSTLHDFYEKLKNSSKHIRFLMMTGVTKLAKLFVFSGLNHLTDLSMDPRFATLLGYTPEELDGPLRENVEAFGAKNGIDFKAAKAALLEWYDGYRFSPDSGEKVCNPVSLGNALKSGNLEGYWEATGKATLIIDRIAKAGKMPADLENVLAGKNTLEVCDAETLPMASLLYQGGYLTIKSVERPKGGSVKYVLAPPEPGGARVVEGRVHLAGHGARRGIVRPARGPGEAAGCARGLEGLSAGIAFRALRLGAARLADQERGGGETLLPAVRVHDGGESPARGRDVLRLRRRGDRDAEGGLRVRVQVREEREGGDPPDPRTRLRRQVDRRQAPRHARGRQLQPEEA